MAFSLLEQKLESAIENINSNIDNIHTINTNKSTISYKYISQIGKGTFGVVHKIKTLENEIFALKTVFEDYNHFYREIEILKILEHENIISLNAYGYSGICEYGKYALLIMEYIPFCLNDLIKDDSWKEIFEGLYHNQKMEIEKKTLDDNINKEHLKNNSTEATNIVNYDPNIHDEEFDLELIVKSFLKQGFSAISYLHSIGICHRDIKPSNILINNNGILKLCDLGSAKKLDSNSTTYICSRFYRAPENIIGIRNYTLKIDVWAFSLSIIEILTKKILFRGTSNSNQLEKILSILKVSQKDISAMKLRRKKNEAIGLKRYLKKYTKNKNLIEVFDKTIKFNHHKRKNACEVLKMGLFQN